MKKFFFAVCILFSFSQYGSAQNNPQTLLWEISKKGNAHTSYLFGTNHFFEAEWLDSFAIVKNKLIESDVVVGETIKRGIPMQNIKVDTNHHKTFQELLNNEELSILDSFLIKKFNTSIIEAPNDKGLIPRLFFIILGDYINQKKKLNNADNGHAIDFEIEDYAYRANKKFIGLDELDSLKSQSKPGILNDSFLAKATIELIKNINTEAKELNTATDKIAADLINWKDLKINYQLYSTVPKYIKDQFGELLTNRNNKWMKNLPKIIENNNSFIAVGIGHLQYETGLITQLRKSGFIVKPVKMK